MDLHRFYRVDLMGLRDGTLTLRKVGVLLAGLPPESATMSALAPLMEPADDDDGGLQRQWSTAEHLLASAVDAINAQTYVMRQLKSAKRLTPPEPLPRPATGKPAPPRRRLTEEQKARMRARNGR